MSTNIAAWFKDVVSDKVTIQYQAHGGMLDGTMMSGDVVGNTVKFPIVGRTEVYTLTGEISTVPVAGPSMSTVQVTLADFEASDWWRVQDAYKAGPNEQQALADIIVMAVRRKRDKIKLDALTTLAGLGGLTTIGTGAETPDITHFVTAASQIAATGAVDEIYCAMPAMWMTQMSFYREFSNSQWVGPDNSPFSKTQRAKSRTFNGVTYIELPDEYFASPGGTDWYSFMWAKNAMGAVTPIPETAADITRQPQLQGSPYLIKQAISGAAIGIQAAGVKRFRLLKLTTGPVRPSL